MMQIRCVTLMQYNGMNSLKKYRNYDNQISFVDLHKICNRATPDQLMTCKMALALHKLYNVDFNPFEFIALNFNHILMGRQQNFISLKSNSFKVGINSLANRFYLLNNKIPLNWLSLSMCSFKIQCKKLFLTN